MTRVLTTLLIIVAASAAVVWAQTDPAEITPSGTPDAAARADSARAIAPPPAAVTAIIFKTSCGRCHGSDRPAVGLSLRAENFAAATIDVPSREKKEFKLVDTEAPEKSYLLMKIRGDEDTIGERMPIGSDPLSEHAIGVVEAWILEVSAAAAADTAAVAEPETPEAPEAVEEPEAAAPGTEGATEAPAAPEAEEETEPAVWGAN